MGDDIGQILFLLAFVIIAAIQWIIKQVQERNKPPEEEEDPLDDTWRQLEEHFEDSRQNQPQQPPPSRPQQPPQREEPVVGGLDDLFRALQQPKPKPKPKPRPQPVAPPPAPTQEFVDPRDSLSVSERAALKELENQRATSITKQRKSVARVGFSELLRGSGNLRNAMILKEIFDRPVSLREDPADQFLKG